VREIPVTVPALQTVPRPVSGDVTVAPVTGNSALIPSPTRARQRRPSRLPAAMLAEK
jgi:hypothetical protein